MKSIVPLFLLMPVFALSQNLVPNGSFEEFETCPSTMDLTGYVSDWYNVLNSCDYFNSCSEIVGVPDNPQSYQPTFDGNGYCGFHTYFLNDPEYREVIGVELLNTLQIGTTYYFSFQMNKADKSDNIKATNNIGIKFSTESMPTETELIDNFAHFKIDSICYDSENWNLITGSFIADAEYTYMFIGNFFDDVNTLTDGPGTIWDRNGYYNIEDVRLSTDQEYAWPTTIEVPSKEVLSIFYNYSMQQLQFADIQSQLEICIVDMGGRLIERGKINRGYNTIDVPHLCDGLYMLTLKDEKTVYQPFRFIKNSTQ